MITDLKEFESETASARASSGLPPLGRILLVEDEPELRQSLIESLTRQGFETVAYSSGSQALAELRQRDFDLLLTDLMMPEMDGIAVLKSALEIDPNLIGVVMTGQGTIQTAVDAMKLGGFDYVLKPFRMQTLMPVLTRAMNLRHLRLENVQLREALAIHGLCQTIAFTLDPQTVLSKLADAALQQSEADEVSILLPTENVKELYVAAVRGEKRERLLGERVAIEDSIASWVAREGRPVILNGEVKDSRFVALWPRTDITSSLSMPMQVAGKLVGVINLNLTGRVRRFTLGQMKALTILASTAAAALESASLYAQVQQAEKNYRSIFENAVEGIFQSTTESRFVTVNPALAQILGYDSPEEVVNHFTDIPTQLYVDPAVAATISQALEGRGVLQGLEVEAYRKDGKKIWLCLNIRVIRNEAGVEIGREGTIEDITEDKQTGDERDRLTAEIESQRQRLNNVVASVPGVVWEAWNQPNVETQQTDFVSDYLRPMLGYSVAEWLATPNFWLTIVHPEDREEAGRVAAEAFASGNVNPQEFRWLTKDGRVIWVEAHYAVIKDEQGQPVGLRGVTIDISQRKWVEDELRRARDFSENLVQTANVIILGLDNEGNINIFNQTAEEITGYTAVELKGDSWFETLVPRDRFPQVWDEFGRLISGGTPTAFENPILTKTGEERHIIWQNNQVTDKGKVVGTISFGNDITERKRAEEALRESVNRKDAILKSALDCVITIDHEGNIIDFNPAAEATFGHRREDVVGKPMAELIIPEARRSRHYAGFASYLATGSSSFLGKRMEVSAMRADGAEIPVELTITAIGSLPHPTFTAFMRDLTERKSREAELRRSEERYRDLVENAHDVIYEHDLEGRYTSSNKAGEQMTGYSLEETLKLTLAETVAPEYLAKAVAMTSRKLAGEEVTAYDLEIIAKDGRRVAVEVNSRLLLQNGVAVGVQGIARDVTERKQLEEQLRQSQKLEAVGQLAGGVAHDFNNLLTVIGGYSSMLLGKMPADSPHRASVEEIKKAGDRAAGLTRQLLAFSRKQILQPVVLDLNVVVSDLDKMLRRLIGEDIDLLTITEPGLGQVNADPGQMEQMVINLIVNARDAMPDGGKLTLQTSNVTLSGEYALKHVPAEAGQYVMVSVSDTGCGMDAETQARIFEPFFTTKAAGKGTGLGLSTVYGIVKQSGGNIWTYSEVNHGTTFKIYLPRVDGIHSSLSEQPSPSVARGTETILLVEDEEQVRQIAEQILISQGYHVLSAANGELALALAANNQAEIHLLITDMVMPQMSGRVLAEHLSALRPKMAVLYMSGYTDDAVVRHGLLGEQLEFIQKPFTADALARKVRSVIHSPSPE